MGLPYATIEQAFGSHLLWLKKNDQFSLSVKSDARKFTWGIRKYEDFEEKFLSFLEKGELKIHQAALHQEIPATMENLKLCAQEGNFVTLAITSAEIHLPNVRGGGLIYLPVLTFDGLNALVSYDGEGTEVTIHEKNGELELSWKTIDSSPLAEKLTSRKETQKKEIDSIPIAQLDCFSFEFAPPR